MQRVLSIPTALAAILMVSAPVAGQETALRDQWSEEIAFGRKSGWGHVRLTPATDGGYRVVRRAWQPISTTQVVETSLEVSTDGAGRILRYALTGTQPLGRTTRTATLANQALRWRVQVRKQPALTGVVKEPVHDPDVLAYLHATGARPAGTHTINVLQLPTGAQSLTYRVTKTKRGIRWDDEDRTWYDAKGRFLGGADPRLPSVSTRPVKSEAEARDLTRGGAETPTARLVEADLTLTRPVGHGWNLQRTPQPQLDVLGMAHAQEVLLLAIPLAAALPSEPKARRAAAEKLLEPLNKAGPKRWFTFKVAGTQAAICRFAGRPAIALEVGGSVGGVPSQGRAWLVAGFAARRTWLVVTAAPKDIAQSEAGRKLLETARAAVKLSAPQRQLVRLTGLGLSYTAPASWRPIPGRRGSRARPDRAGQIHLGRIPHAAGTSPKVHQEETLARIKRLIPDAKITAQGAAKLNGTQGHRMVIEGHVPRAGRPVPARVIAWLVPRGDGTAVWLTVIGLRLNGFDPAELKVILKSVRWTEAG